MNFFLMFQMFDVLNESIPMFVMVSQLSLGLSEGCWFSLTNVIKKFPTLKTLIIEVYIYNPLKLFAICKS